MSGFLGLLPQKPTPSLIHRRIPPQLDRYGEFFERLLSGHRLKTIKRLI